MKPSLARRLTLAGAILITVTASAVATLGFRTTSAFLTARYQEHLRVLAQYAALHTELGLLLQDPDVVRSAVETLVDQADLQGIKVLDEKDRPVYVHQRHPWVEDARLRWVDVPVWTREIQNTLPGLDTDTAPRRIGTVRLGYRLDTLQGLLRQLVLRFALFTTGLIVVSALVYGAIARSLTHPLRRLEAAARDVAQGHLAVRAPQSGLRETDQVAHMFNAMLDALARREKDLEQLNARLCRREALAEVGRFSSMVAHEIKNPLTILRGSLQVLQRPDPDGTTHDTALRFMEEEVRRMDRLVSDFLLFAKPVVADRRPGNWVAWLQKASEKMRLLAEGGDRLHVEITGEGHVAGRFDAALMETALGHLVRNALEATRQGGLVRVKSWTEPHATAAQSPDGHTAENFEKDTLKDAAPRDISASHRHAYSKKGMDAGEPNALFDDATRHQAIWWCFAVEDSGPGVPEEHREKIFEPFFTTKAKGSGLGLAMVRRIVEAHGGTVFWTPGLGGKGSRFVVRVPAVLQVS
ncbi:signal transduction histidine kinase [Desulfosoma caldarium]|uniref:Signal transduction histidine-protein kinase/phosphatase MprB n=2 Tax=Desulfosoma caldarium TaxID=610254 RepID=A0A3N1VTQ4_9BACT|nr:signal transduction histidine kinase [Desulfosoma caldarium]